MMQYLWLIPVGFGVGACGTLIGAGGGFLLMPILLLVYPADSPALLTSISLAVVFFNASSGSWAYHRMRRIHYNTGLLFSAGTVPGAILGALTANYIPRRLFNTVFGFLMLAASAYLLLHPDSKRAQKNTHRNTPSAPREPHGVNDHFSYNRTLGVVLSLAVGYVIRINPTAIGVDVVPTWRLQMNFVSAGHP